MNHSILVTVNGYSWTATATTERTRSGREVTAVSCTDVPLIVMAAIEDQAVSIHDVLEIIRYHLNDTANKKRDSFCGPVVFEWLPLNPEYLRADILGRTFEVRLTDCHGRTHEYTTGAGSNWEAMDIATAALGLPVRSSVVIPLGL